MILPAIGSPGEMVGASRRCSEDPFLSVPAPTLIDEGLLKLNPAPALPAFDPPTAGVSFDGREGDEVVCDEVVCDEVFCDEVVCDEVVCDEVVCDEVFWDEVFWDEVDCDEVVCDEVFWDSHSLTGFLLLGNVALT